MRRRAFLAGLAALVAAPPLKATTALVGSDVAVPIMDAHDEMIKRFAATLQKHMNRSIIDHFEQSPLYQGVDVDD